MVVCTYFNQGYCRYGDRCRFDHPFKGPTAGSSQTFGGFGGQPRQQTPSAAAPAAPGSFTELLNGIATEMKTWENSKQWPFSCFSPLKGHPCIPGLSDLSPEEVRAEAYKSQVANTPDVYLQFFNTQVAEYRQKRASLHNASPEMRAYMQQMFSASVSGGGGAAGSVLNTGASQNAKSLFGGGSGTASAGGLFGKPAVQPTSGASVFGGQSQTAAGSVFGGQTQTTGSVFGGQTQQTQSVFGGQSSVFGGQTQQTGSVFGGQAPAAGSVFGGQSQSTGSVFGGQSQSTGSVFGGQTQSAGSVFGGQSQPTSSVFGGQSQPSSSVFGGQAPAAGSVFGTQPPATAAGSVFGGQPQSGVTSVFGGPPAAGSGQTPSTAPTQPVSSGGTSSGGGSVFGSQTQSVAAPGGGGLFGKGGPAAPTAAQDPSPAAAAAAAAAEAYSEPTELSDADRAQFAATEFTLGKVPLLPPTKEMCVR